MYIVVQHKYRCLCAPGAFSFLQRNRFTYQVKELLSGYPVITTFRFKCQLIKSVCTEHDLYSVALVYFEFVAGETYEYEDVHLEKIRTVLYLDYLLHERAPGA
jgi:hypothetical protein